MSPSPNGASETSAYPMAAGVPLSRLPLDRMRAVEPRMTEAVYDVLTVARSVKSRASFGGTAPKNVRRMAKAWIKRLESAPPVS